MNGTHYYFGDNSIQSNLRRKALVKKASERTWREWDAMYDFEVRENQELHHALNKYRSNVAYLALAASFFGIAFGIFLALFVFRMVTVG